MFPSALVAHPTLPGIFDVGSPKFEKRVKLEWVSQDVCVAFFFVAASQSAPVYGSVCSLWAQVWTMDMGVL